LHAELAAFHPAGEFHFALTGEQRNSAHLAEVNPNRIIRVNGFFHRRRAVEVLSVVGFIHLKKFRLHLERKSAVFRLLGQKLIFEMVQSGLTSLFTTEVKYAKMESAARDSLGIAEYRSLLGIAARTRRTRTAI
jgi:hypothetical protein